MKKHLIIFCLVFIAQLGLSQDLEKQLDQKVTVSYKNTPINVIFKIMSTSYNFNYVITQVGDERVTVNITNAPLKEALNAILLPLGYHYFIQDNMVIIKKIEDSASSELNTYVYKCKYKSAEKMIEVVKQALSPAGLVITPEGESQDKERISPRISLLVIKDVDYKIDEILKILEVIDIKEPQILIEIKLVERIIGDNKKAGVNWPTRIGAKTLSYPPQEQQGGGGAGQEQYLGWLTELPSVSDDWQWGVVTVDALNIYMELLRSESNSKIIANPKVATENNVLAIVNIATTVPIAELSRSAQGDLITYKDKEVSSYIEVLPVINADGSISLTVHPVLEEIVGYTGGESGFPQPIVAKREVRTKITVKNGEALILGGLIKETESKVVNKLFLLGDIPVLGYLFRHYTIQKDKSDLLIIVTPKIIGN